MQFKDHLIKQGLEGGKKAAYALRQAVYTKVQNPDDTEIVAKIFANLDGLIKTLSSNTATDIKDFMAGFTQAKASFDFVDVGDVRSDTKIKETARFNLWNYNCVQVLLGISHDPSYSTFLKEIELGRVAILEGAPVAKELASTGVQIATQFDAIFRSDRLLEKPAAPSSRATSSIASTPVSVSSVPFTCKLNGWLIDDTKKKIKKNKKS